MSNKIKAVLFGLIVILSVMSCDVYRDDVAPKLMPSIAHDDQYITPVNTPVMMDILGNDTLRTAVSVVLTTPHNGVVVAKMQGNNKVMYQYTPNLNFSGKDSLYYTLADNNSSASALIRINVVNNDTVLCRVIANRDYAETIIDYAIIIPVLNNDETCNVPIDVEIINAPTNGFANIDQLNRIRYIPARGFAGTETIRYALRNPAGRLSEAELEIRVAYDTSCIASFRAIDDSVHIQPTEILKISCLSFMDNDIYCTNDLDPNSFTITEVGPGVSARVIGNNGGYKEIEIKSVNSFTGNTTFKYTINNLNTANRTHSEGRVKVLIN